MAKFGTPEWKPISETRRASVQPVYKVYCDGCCTGVMYTGPNKAKAEEVAAAHDARHSTKNAECCMYSRECVCTCGNVLL